MAFSGEPVFRPVLCTQGARHVDACSLGMPVECGACASSLSTGPFATAGQGSAARGFDITVVGASKLQTSSLAHARAGYWLQQLLNSAERACWLVLDRQSLSDWPQVVIVA